MSQNEKFTPEICIPYLQNVTGLISHALNNGLAGPLGYIELAAKAKDDSKRSEFLEKAGISLQECLKFIRKLQSFSAGMPLKRVPVNLKKFFESKISDLSVRMGAAVHIDLHVRDDVCAFVDPAQLEIMILNLFDNAKEAIDAAAKEGGNIGVQIGKARKDDATGNGDYIMIAIQDNAGGMSNEVLQRVFEPFFTTRKSRTNAGLGLSVVYGLVQAHKGYVKLESKPDIAKTTVRIFLPMCSEEQKVAAKVESGEISARILVVDDEKMILDLLEQVFDISPYHVVMCSSGKEALAKVSQATEPFDLLITDLLMPGMGGIELSIQLVQQYPEMKVMYMTGYTGASHLNLHGKIVMEKPFQPLDLLKVVEDVLKSQ